MTALAKVAPARPLPRSCLVRSRPFLARPAATNPERDRDVLGVPGPGDSGPRGERTLPCPRAADHHDAHAPTTSNHAIGMRSPILHRFPHSTEYG